MKSFPLIYYKQNFTKVIPKNTWVSVNSSRHNCKVSVVKNGRLSLYTSVRRSKEYLGYERRTAAAAFAMAKNFGYLAKRKRIISNFKKIRPEKRKFFKKHKKSLLNITIGLALKKALLKKWKELISLKNVLYSKEYHFLELRTKLGDSKKKEQTLLQSFKQLKIIFKKENLKRFKSLKKKKVNQLRFVLRIKNAKKKVVKGLIKGGFRFSKMIEVKKPSFNGCRKKKLRRR